MEPMVSVIVATRNRKALLAQTLASLASQDWPFDRLEIVVADNGSTDGTRTTVAAIARPAGGPTMHYLFVEPPGKSYAINAALARAQGDLILFTDDDVIADSRWVRRIAAAFAETAADFVAGRILPRWEIPPPTWMSPRLYGVLAIPDGGNARQVIGGGGTTDVMPIGANMAVRAHVLRRLGGLRADLGKLEGTLRTGEDHEFFLRMIRANCRGVYEPSAVVRHLVPRERLRRRYFRRWLYQNGRDVARIDRVYATGTRRLLGAPRYRWRVAALDAVRALQAAATLDERSFLASGLCIVWFAGYLRETWLSHRHHDTAHDSSESAPAGAGAV